MNVSRFLSRLRYGARHPMARAGLWALTLALFGAALSVGLSGPASRARARLDDAVSEQRRALVDARQAVEVQRAYAHAARAVPDLENKLRQTVSPAQLVDRLGQLARRHGVRIIAEAYEEGRQAHPPEALVADLTLTGSYSGLRRFIEGLSELPTWSIADELRMEVVRGSTDLRARLRVVTYFGGVPSAPGGNS